MDKGELGEDVVSMVDVLQEDNDLEEEANAVFGDSDDQHCTYPKGYLSRQALYSCSTCIPATSEPAGVCLACSLTCHDGHELYELYTKRNFRCDCGNSRFKGIMKCKLCPDKDKTNSKNSYNQNFKGVYCTCHKPYPDPEDEIEDEMIQCVVCEDWYHSRHLGSLPPAEGDFQEMICDACMERCPFLQAYLSLSAPSQTGLGPSQQVITKEEKDFTVDVVKSEKTESTKAEAESEANDVKTRDNQTSCGKEAESKQTVSSLSSSDETKKQVNGEEDESKKDAVKNEQRAAECDCKLFQLQASITEIRSAASFWNTGWRCQLCTCNSCKDLYSSLGVSFLMDEQDTIVAYEERGKQAQASKMTSYESGMQALEGMGRINQVEAIHGYNDMKNELTDYLREFADQGKVVTSEDIKSFFDSMQSRKRQRTGSASTIQYQCK
ncbi:putative E3 ubiquitin-protein ligase UBR7 [Actinia tenebrosa]|uniref:Putative E3 ubiquitin-protein ligase UBR7 n=1 Tax=Actinia tenebrosa TaxID=6105 RepID=A0A6P8IWM6_ACTTE|nr:putative E3 ubiquitin-protein ligase UBR7 [Actinia tenebrosa]